LQRQITIVNELGLHARPAARIAQLAASASARVWIEKDRVTADAASVIDILALGAPKGATLTVRIEDPTDRGIMDAVADLIEKGLGEITDD
jgi:phosphocarrier protein